MSFSTVVAIVLCVCGRAAGQRTTDSSREAVIATPALLGAADFVVTSPIDGSPGSFRAALVAANAVPSPSTISFGPSVAGKRLYLDPALGPLNITESVSIFGRKATLVGPGTDYERIVNDSPGLDSDQEPVIFIGRLNSSVPLNAVIHELNVQAAASDCILVLQDGGASLTVSASHITDCGDGGIDFDGFNQPATNGTLNLKHVVIARTGSDAVLINSLGGTRLSIEDSVIEASGDDGLEAQCFASPIPTSPSPCLDISIKRVKFRDNTDDDIDIESDYFGDVDLLTGTDVVICDVADCLFEGTGGNYAIELSAQPFAGDHGPAIDDVEAIPNSRIHLSVRRSTMKHYRKAIVQLLSCLPPFYTNSIAPLLGIAAPEYNITLSHVTMLKNDIAIQLGELSGSIENVTAVCDDDRPLSHTGKRRLLEAAEDSTTTARQAAAAGPVVTRVNLVDTTIKDNREAGIVFDASFPQEVTLSGGSVVEGGSEYRNLKRDAVVFKTGNNTLAAAGLKPSCIAGFTEEPGVSGSNHIATVLKLPRPCKGVV